MLHAIEPRGDLGAEAIAVCLLWSIVNPRPRAARRRADRASTCRACRSRSRTQLNPIIREYRRASSTAIDASLKPLMQEYLSTHGAAICARRASPGTLLSRRRSAAPGARRRSIERPIYSVGSGPSMAPVAALTYAQAEFGEEVGRRPVVCDTGGTTFDVGLVTAAARSTTTAETWLGGRWIGHITGHPLGRRQVDRRRRRLDRLDRSGRSAARRPSERGRRPRPSLLRPRRHASRPSPTPPSCSAGSTPTTSWAGVLPLDADAAPRPSSRAIAGPLGLERRRGRYAALTIATENIVGAIREITIAQGIDPREVTARRRRRRLRPEHRPDRARARLPPRAAAVARPARSRPAARSSRTSISEFSRSRYAETRSLDRDAVNEALAESRRGRTRSSTGLRGLDPVARRARTSSSRPATARRSGSSTCPSRLGSSRDDGRARARGGLPRRRTSASSPSASPASTSSACSGRRARRPCSRKPDRAAARSRRPERPSRRSDHVAGVLPRDRTRAGAAATTARLCRPGRTHRRARRSSASRPRRSSSTPARALSSRRSATTCSSSSRTQRTDSRCGRSAAREPRPRRARGDRQPARLDRPRDGEHAPAHRSLGGAEHGPRLLLRADHRRQPAARLRRGPAGARDRHGVPRARRDRPARRHLARATRSFTTTRTSATPTRPTT